MIYLALLKRFWPFLAGAALLAGVGLWHTTKVREARAQGYAQARVEYQAEMDNERERQREINERTERDWSTKVDALNRRSLSIVAGDIRLCVPAPEVRTAHPASSADDPPPRPRPIVRAGENIAGPALVFASQCERDRQQLIALQSWILSSR